MILWRISHYLSLIGDSLLSNHDFGAYSNQIRQLLDFLIGERDTALGPIEASVNFRITLADTVNPNVSTQHRILRWSAGDDHAVVYVPVAPTVDHPGAQGTVEMTKRRVV